MCWKVFPLYSIDVHSWFPNGVPSWFIVRCFVFLCSISCMRYDRLFLDGIALLTKFIALRAEQKDSFQRKQFQDSSKVFNYFGFSNWDLVVPRRYSIKMKAARLLQILHPYILYNIFGFFIIIVCPNFPRSDQC